MYVCACLFASSCTTVEVTHRWSRDLTIACSYWNHRLYSLPLINGTTAVTVHSQYGQNLNPKCVILDIIHYFLVLCNIFQKPRLSSDFLSSSNMPVRLGYLPVKRGRAGLVLMNSETPSLQKAHLPFSICVSKAWTCITLRSFGHLNRHLRSVGLPADIQGIWLKGMVLWVALLDSCYIIVLHK